MMGIWYSSNPSSGADEFAKMLLKGVGKPDRLIIDTATTTALYASRTEIKANEVGYFQVCYAISPATYGSCSYSWPTC